MNVKIDTEYDPIDDKLSLMALDYQTLEVGEHKYKVKLADVLPSGITLLDDIETVDVTVTVKD